MPLRDYQEAALNAVARYASEGVTRQVISCPTGTGKTAIAAHLPEYLGLQPYEATLFLVRSDEQQEQAARSFKSFNPHLSVSVEMGNRKADTDADVIVASVQTLARPNRREKFGRDLFRLIITDECHRSVSQQYLDVFQYFRVLKGDAECDPSRFNIGFSATPRRHDTRGLERVFDKIVFNRSIREMIVAGWMADVHCYRIATGTDISGVAKRQGDFATGQLEEAVNTPDRNALVVQKYLEFGAGLPFLAFTVDVQHSDDLADTFRQHGIECHAVSGKTPIGKRRELVEAFKAGQIPGLASCQVFSEGTDFPNATVGLMTRPTLSSVWYTQSLGRLLRPYPAPEAKENHTGYVKQHSIVLDFTDNPGRLSLFNVATLFGLHADFDLKGSSARRTAEAVELFEHQHPGLDLKAYPDLDSLQAAAYSVDLFRPLSVPAIAKRFSRFAWLQRSEDTFRLALANKTTLYVVENQLGQFEVEIQTNGNRAPAGTFDTAEEAFAFADSNVPDEVIGAALTNARWRNAPPSEKQARVIWLRDKTLRQQFSSDTAYFKYARSRYYAKDKAFTKGAFSQRIDMLKFNKGGL
jgi:superfamily II DNA or RNA helicase